jgi:hypothetical protein
MLQRREGVQHLGAETLAEGHPYGPIAVAKDAIGRFATGQVFKQEKVGAKLQQIRVWWLCAEGIGFVFDGDLDPTPYLHHTVWLADERAHRGCQRTHRATGILVNDPAARHAILAPCQASGQQDGDQQCRR